MDDCGASLAFRAESLDVYGGPCLMLTGAQGGTCLVFSRDVDSRALVMLTVGLAWCSGRGSFDVNGGVCLTLRAGLA